MEAVGAIRYNPAEAQARLAASTARAASTGPDPVRDDETCRRPLIEYTYAAAARKTPGGWRSATAAPPPGLVTGSEVIPGVPHITGVRTASGETIDARVVVDAAGRRTPLSAMIEAAGGRQSPEHAFEAGFGSTTPSTTGGRLSRRRGTAPCAPSDPFPY